MDLVGLVITPSTSTLLSEEFTGSVPTQLTDESRYDTSPSWSPDATRLAYLSKPSGGDPRHPLWHVWVVNADGTGAVDLTPNANTGYDLDRLSWVPDGSKIAATRNGAIMVVNVDGTGARQITDEGKGLSNPVWSPDGSEIAVRGTRSDFFNTSIYIIPAEGGHEKRVTVPLNDMTTYDTPIAWITGQDTGYASRIVFVRSGGWLYSVNAASRQNGKETKIGFLAEWNPASQVTIWIE